MFKHIDFEPDAPKALEEGSAIVALESAGAFDGIPYPENRDTIQTLANHVRSIGTIPAHIVIKDGRIKVGQSDEEIEDFAKMQGNLVKASRRDIPMLIAQKKNAVKTIAATTLIADLVGIKGKNITPYLVRSVKAQMGSESVEAQKHLRLNNAELAAKIAKSLS